MGEETPVQSDSVLSSTAAEQVSTEQQHASVETVLEDAEVKVVAVSAKGNDPEEIPQQIQPAVTSVEVQPEATPTEVEPQIAVPAPGVIYQRRSDGMPQFMYDAVARIAPEQGFTPGHFEITFESGSSKGDGFVAEMFRATITEGDRKLVVLCKIPPINDTHRHQFGLMPLFDREVTAYSKLLPAMYEFQREKGVTEEMDIGFFNAPQCYLAYADLPKEESVIIMDDLRLKDYRMWNKLVPTNYEHTRLLMIQLGRLHAVSLAMREQRPEVFEQFKVPDPLNAMMRTNQGFIMMMNMSMDRAIGTLESHEEKARRKLSKLKETMFDDISTITSAEYAEPYAVLGHGDCWINNMIYSYKRGVPTEIVLLDWQLCRYASPALDLLYFIFVCTDEAFRRQYYDEMLRIYYNSLGQLLEKLGGDPSRLFPFTALLRQLKACGKFGILMALLIVPMICVPDMNEAANSEDKYRTRMAAIIRDLIRYGYL
nr:uncharacterized protein LOC109428073 [Aedes albopictus]